jgi:hypothetical protein
MRERAVNQHAPPCARGAVPVRAPPPSPGRMRVSSVRTSDMVHSLVRELGFALFHERSHSFLLVVGGEGGVEHTALKAHTLR